MGRLKTKIKTNMTKILTKGSFIEKVFDYENNEEWTFKGERPALIDFYAEWCGPCKTLAPVLDELSKEYDGLIDIYKINTENEAELSSVFGIRSIPSLLFIPMGEQPQMAAGALPKDALIEAFKDILKVEK